MSADDFEHFVLVACAFALVVAMVLALPLIWSDLQRDLRRRVEEDAEAARPVAPPYDWQLDLDEVI